MFLPLRQLLTRPSVQAAVRNFGWLVTEKAVRLVLGVGVGFWVARYLGPTQFGVLGYCVAVVTLVGFLPAFGLDAIVKRELLERPDATTEIVGSAIALRFVAGACAYAALLAVAASGWGFSAQEAELIAVLGILLLQPALVTPDLWLQAHLRAANSVAMQLLALVLGSALRVWLILSAGTLLGFAVVVAVEMTVGAMALALVARRLGLRVSITAARRATIVALAREAWPLLFASLAVMIYMKIDEVMLRQMAGVAAVGIYSAAVKLSEVWYFLPMVFGSSVLPALLRARERNAEEYRARLQHYYDVSAAAAYALSIPIALLAPWIVRTAYGPAYAAAGPILAVHIWSSVFVFLGVARGQWLVNERLNGFYLATTVAGAVANVLLNLWAIPRWGGLGAAYATVVSYALAAWIGSFCHPRVRATAWMQTRALLLPLLGWRYFRRA